MMAEAVSQMTEYEFHPIAGIFPMIAGDELAQLVDDIRAHGVREPVWLYDGKILDGRNRYMAAKKAGAQIQTREFTGSPLEAIEFVWSLNRTRRHMNSSQAAVADAKRNQMTDAYAPVREAAKERQVQAGKTHGRGQEKLKEKIPEPIFAPIMPDGVDYVRHGGSIWRKPESSAQTRDIRAKTAGTNPKYIDLADRLVKERPDLADQVEAGKKTLSQVTREIRQEELRERTPAPPTGKYRVIYADPPWKYNDAMAISKNGLGESYGPAEAHYPAMTISELCALPINDLAEENAVLFLWTTSPLLEDTFKIINAWGFKYKSSFVWDKVKHNMGHYNSVRHEFLLVCTRGSCTPDVKKLFDSVQSIEREEHSRKPEEFRQIIDTIYTEGQRIELFRRGDAPSGWKAWGNEAKEAAA